MFYGVPVKPGTEKAEGEYVNYGVFENQEPKPVGEFLKEYVVFVLMSSETPISNVVLFNLKEGGVTSETYIENLKEGEFGVFGMVIENKTGDTVGFVNTSFVSTGTEDELNMYLPIVMKEGYPSSENPVSVESTEIEKLTNTLAGCGIQPASQSEQNCG
jgi:hypothetical protein